MTLRANRFPAGAPFGAPGHAFFADGWPEASFLEACGITRIGDLTGLDTIGIPVWFACRPNSRGISVAQGKGLTDEQARISAVMEAVEGAVAEQTVPLIAMTESIRSMRSRGAPIVPLEHMPRCRASRIEDGITRSWVPGYGHASGKPVYAPYELVGLDMRTDSAWDHGGFLMSTIGLAAGPTAEHAILHATCELIENDATTMIDLLGVRGSGARGIDCGGTEHAGLARAMAAVEAAGMTVRFFDVTGVVPVPVVACFVEASFVGGRMPAVGISAGFACRPRGADAALAALLEAVQSRLTKIAGSREDLSEASYLSGRSRLPDAVGEMIPVSTLRTPGYEDDLDDPAAMLRTVTEAVVTSSAAKEIHVFPLLPETAGFAVTRVLIPHFETVVEEGTVKLGTHALKRLLALKERR